MKELTADQLRYAMLYKSEQVLMLIQMQKLALNELVAMDIEHFHAKFMEEGRTEEANKLMMATQVCSDPKYDDRASKVLLKISGHMYMSRYVGDESRRKLPIDKRTPAVNVNFYCNTEEVRIGDLFVDTFNDAYYIVADVNKL